VANYFERCPPHEGDLGNLELSTEGGVRVWGGGDLPTSRGRGKFTVDRTHSDAGGFQRGGFGSRKVKLHSSTKQRSMYMSAERE